MYIPKGDTQNYHFCRLKLVVETFEHSTFWVNQSKFFKVAKVVKPMNERRNYKILGTIIINNPLAPII